MSRKYFYLYRPPCYGCQPDGFIRSEGGLPQREYKTQWGKIRAFGWVEYTDPLTNEEMWKWELAPDNPVEWAQYVFWEQADRDYDTAEYLRCDYVQAYLNKTGRIPDYLLEPTRILAEAGVK